jgi:hypothetical protein
MTSDARRLVRPVIFFVAFVVAATTMLAARQTPAPAAGQTTASPPPAPPKVLTKLLDKKYPHWQLAPFAPGSDGCTAKTASPSIVNLDVNNDGFGDWAMQIQSDANVKLVVAVGWLQDFHLYEIDSTPGSNATRALSMVHRGSSFMNPTNLVQDFYSNDSIVATPCGGAPTVYRWNGDGFTPLVLKASARPTP